MARTMRMRLALLAMAASVLGSGPALAGNGGLPPSAAESFPIGTKGALCEAQGVSLKAERTSVFDRKWALLCRDASGPVGWGWKTRGAVGVDADLDCAPGEAMAVEGLGGVSAATCRSRSTGLVWRSYSLAQGKWKIAVRGLSGYDSALMLALRSLAADRVVPGEVAIATTGEGASLAKAKAALGDPDLLIGQGYRQNNAGSYAEAAELFEPDLLVGTGNAADTARREHELTVNKALQLSNLGRFDEAAALFARARSLGARDPVQSRLGRNFEAIDALNRGDTDGALAILAREVAPLTIEIEADGKVLSIDAATAQGINAGSSRDRASILGQEVRLTIPERAAIIDAQADQLRGTALRLEGKLAEARTALERANSGAMAVRQGRVVSITRLRAQILSELASTEESAGDLGRAESLLRQAQTLVETQYPDSVSLNGARARLAGFLTRHGRGAEARPIYKSIVDGLVGTRGALVGLSNLIRPYFAMLAADAASNEGAASDLFLASQLVERPGAADSLAQLSRQLEGGTGPAGALYRQALNVGREVERNRILIAQANAAVAAGQAAPQLADLTQQQERLVQLQLSLLSSLSAYPQFRSVARGYVTLADMRAVLKPGEAYFKLTALGDDYYGVFVSQGVVRGWKVAGSGDDIAGMVSTLRDSISVTVNGVRSTYPFDLATSAALYDALLGPVAGDLAGVRHLVFEPDGALLQLPLNLLVTDRAGIAAYNKRVEDGGDEFDFRGIAWLGRTRAVSTALSAASFRDARNAPASTAHRAYLGLGQNLPLGPVTSLPSVRGVSGGMSADCSWPVATWNQPVAGTELRQAASIFGTGTSRVLTDGAFTDTAVKTMPDLADFRVVHFATHGLVTAPRDGCPARPALLTSFGGEGSQGLLRFDEIFNLHMDADLVILSACDTAAQASLEATREAGLSTGGGQALDGLVRAFIAAGGRQVIASHWPAPDDYGATGRLFTRFFAGKGESVGEALRNAELALMDDPETSHPFYWSGFAVIGDGMRPVSGQ